MIVDTRVQGSGLNLKCEELKGMVTNNTKRIQRARIIQLIREYFWQIDFIEVDTPSLVLSPGMEPHIRPIAIRSAHATAKDKIFLPTSPEFAMKKILSQGVPKIFQICKAYRDEPLSQTHNPEFAMLEWYRCPGNYETIMNDTENLLSAVCRQLHGREIFMHPRYGQQHLAKPMKRIRIEDCFRQFAQIDLIDLMRSFLDSEPKDTEAFNDEFFRIFLNQIEPALAELGGPVIVYDYPWTQAALANTYVDHRGIRWAKRFEVYAGGLELANAFDELVDSVSQRKRFEEDMAIREKIYGAAFPANPIDEEFIECLSKINSAGGIALGVDRLVMYLTGADYLHEVLWGTSHW